MNTKTRYHLDVVQAHCTNSIVRGICVDIAYAIDIKTHNPSIKQKAYCDALETTMRILEEHDFRMFRALLAGKKIRKVYLDAITYFRKRLGKKYTWECRRLLRQQQ